MQKLSVLIAGGMLCCCSGSTSLATMIHLPAANPVKYDAGFFEEGSEVTLSATGVAVLCWQFTTQPDGSLAAPFPAEDRARIHAIPGCANYPTTSGGDGINHFDGGGMNYVPGHGDIGWPVAGRQTTDTLDPAAIRFGALVGTFSDNPKREDWFYIGVAGRVVVPRGGAHLYLLVNDSWYGDNSGEYRVTIETSRPVAVNTANESSLSASVVYTQSPDVLPRDASFGYALPTGISLTHQIEASPDLVEWTAATNVVLFFRDLDSSNFNSRFYRFRERK